MLRVYSDSTVSVSRQKETQIPFGDDNKKNRGNSGVQHD